jgi:hypothetical protein
VVFSGADLFKTTAPQVLVTRSAGPSTFRGGVQVSVAPVNGGDPGFIERMYVMARLIGTLQVDTFSLLNTDQYAGRGN